MEKLKCSGCKKYVEKIEMHTLKTCLVCRDRQQEIRKTDLYKKKKRIYYERNKFKAGEYGFSYRRSAVGRFKKARKAALRMKINFELTFEQYCKKISEPCYYCNGFFPQVIAGGGLDKIDPLKGYTYNNVISCCRTCNIVKSNIFTKEETKIAIDAIIKYRKE